MLVNILNLNNFSRYECFCDSNFDFNFSQTLIFILLTYFLTIKFTVFWKLSYSIICTMTIIRIFYNALQINSNRSKSTIRILLWLAVHVKYEHRLRSLESFSHSDAKSHFPDNVLRIHRWKSLVERPVLVEHLGTSRRSTESFRSCPGQKAAVYIYSTLSAFRFPRFL